MSRYDLAQPDQYGPPWCAACRGFTCEQLVPGIFTVCRSCSGSSVRTVTGDRRPGMVLRNSRLGEVETGGEKSGNVKRDKGRMSLEGFR